MSTLDDILSRDIAHFSDLVKTASGDLDTVSGLANLQMALFHRLITSPGTLAHRPGYGVGIKDFQNAPASLTNQRKLAARIQEQYEQDPRVISVLGVRVDVDEARPDMTKLTVRVDALGFGEVALTSTPFGEGV